MWIGFISVHKIRPVNELKELVHVVGAALEKLAIRIWTLKVLLEKRMNQLLLVSESSHKLGKLEMERLRNTGRIQLSSSLTRIPRRHPNLYKIWDTRITQTI